MTILGGRMVPWLCAALLQVLAWGCDDDAPPSEAATATAPTSPPPRPREEVLLQAELQRDFDAVRTEDLRARDVAVRRAALRALARMRDARARPALQAALTDEDETVVAWAAYGLGDLCAGARDATVSALVAAAAARAAKSAETPPEELSADAAIVRAVGRCGNERAEAVLAGWARDGGPLVPHAIAALGDIARARKRLREETQAALLGLAEGDASRPPIPEALYPLGRVDHLTPSVIERAREVANERLDAGALAVKVLARTGEDAVPKLAEILTSNRDAATRVEAARALATMGRTGQKALADALGKVTIVTAVDPAVHVPLAILSLLTDTRNVRPRLKELATLDVETKTDAEKRRVSLIRCAAAKLMAERTYDLPELRACDLFVPAEARGTDPLPSAIGGRAVLDAIGIDAVKLRGPRLAAWKAYAKEAPPPLREAALRQLGPHDEVDEAAAILADALDAEPGVVATAAEVIAAHPARAMTKGAVDEAVKKALLTQLSSQKDLEARGAVIGAVAALGLTEAKKELIDLCGDPRRSLREHAERALAKLMPEGAPRCRGGGKHEVPVEIVKRAEKVRLVLRTDAGDLGLTLDGWLAPIAVARARDLAKGDYFDALVVHRVVPGFVAQFGSPTGDGYGGIEGLPALPCETSPVPFTERSVGVALAGRDTGSSQFFVTFAPAPHLDGEYAWLGTADGPWEALVEGDVIHDVVVD